MLSRLQVGSGKDWWDSAVLRLPENKRSVYCSYDWVSAAATLEQGLPELAFWQDMDGIVLHPYVKRQIPGTKYYDLISAFDFGGWWSEGRLDLLEYDEAYSYWQRRSDVISEFVRLHPASDCPTGYDVTRVRDNVCLAAGPSAVNHYDHKLRTDLRKSRSFGLDIRFVPVEDWVRLYHGSILDKGRSPYYLFPRGFFEAIWSRAFCLGAYLPTGELAAAHLYINDRKTMFYFLAASNPGLLYTKPNDAIIDLMLRTCHPPADRLHLGGGEPESLMRFKEKFGPGRIPYYVATRVFNQGIYDDLPPGALPGRFPRYR